MYTSSTELLNHMARGCRVSLRLCEGFVGSKKVALYPSRRAWRPPGPQTTGLATRTDSFVRSSFSYTSANYFYLVKFVDTNLTILNVFIHNRFGYQHVVNLRREPCKPSTGSQK